MLTSEFSRIWGIHDTIIIMDAQTGLLSPRGGYGHHIWWSRFFLGGAFGGTAFWSATEGVAVGADASLTVSPNSAVISGQHS